MKKKQDFPYAFNAKSTVRGTMKHENVDIRLAYTVRSICTMSCLASQRRRSTGHQSQGALQAGLQWFAPSPD